MEGGGGGVSEEEAWEGEGRWGNVCGEGGGAKYFSRAEIPTKESFCESGEGVRLPRERG